MYISSSEGTQCACCRDPCRVAAAPLSLRRRPGIAYRLVNPAIPGHAVTGKDPGCPESFEPVERGQGLLWVIGERCRLWPAPAGQDIAGRQCVTDEDCVGRGYVDGDAAGRVA